MMRRFFYILVAAAVSMTAAAQNSVESLRAMLDSNRVSFKYTISAKDRPQIGTSGTMLIDGDCYHMSTKGADIWCDGMTKWTVDSEAKEVYIEKADIRDFLSNPSAYLDLMEDLKFSDKSVSGVYNEPSQGAAVAFKLTSIKYSPLTGNSVQFFFDVSVLDDEWVVTDLR